MFFGVITFLTVSNSVCHLTITFVKSAMGKMFSKNVYMQVKYDLALIHFGAKLTHQYTYEGRLQMEDWQTDGFFPSHHSANVLV